MSVFFFLHTMGCKANQYESQALREAWLGKGYKEALAPKHADIIILNSCAVTNRAVADLRRTAHRLLRENKHASMIITGCAAQVSAKELAKLFPNAKIIPQSQKDSLLQSFAGIKEKKKHITFPPFSIKNFNRTRAVVKVQDGCSHCCTYCIVPKTRGLPVSRKPEETLAEAERLFQAGITEITLSGINLRQYGQDLSPIQDFWDLLAYLDSKLSPHWQGRARIRLSSLDPAQLGEKALETIQKSTLLCPHLHLSLQSLSPNVLQRMARGHYQPENIATFLLALKNIWPLFGLGADLIAGFPGETDKDHARTLFWLNKFPLSYGHIFPYSPRPGTPAAKYAAQVQENIKQDRARVLRQVLAEKQALFLQELTRLDLITVITQAGQQQKGMCEYYVPCHFIKNASSGQNTLLPVKPVSTGHGCLLVEPMNL